MMKEIREYLNNVSAIALFSYLGFATFSVGLISKVAMTAPEFLMLFGVLILLVCLVEAIDRTK